MEEILFVYAARIYYGGNRKVMAEMIMSDHSQVTIEWSDPKQREEYQKMMGSHALIFDERIIVTFDMLK